VDRGTIDTDESTTLLRMGDCSGSLNKSNILLITTLEDSEDDMPSFCRMSERP